MSVTLRSLHLIKRKLASPHVLVFPRFDLPFCLAVDTSDYGAGAVLSQEIRSGTRIGQA